MIQFNAEQYGKIIISMSINDCVGSSTALPWKAYETH